MRKLGFNPLKPFSDQFTTVSSWPIQEIVFTNAGCCLAGLQGSGFVTCLAIMSHVIYIFWSLIIRTNSSIFLSAYMHTYMHTDRHTYICIYAHTHIHIYAPTYTYIYIYIYARTHITCIYIYIYTHMWMKFNDFEKTLCISCWHDIFIHHHGHDKLNAVNICMVLNIWLVVWNILYFHILGIIWNNHPNWRTHIFQRGRTTNQNYWYYNHYYSIIPLLMIIQL